MTHIGPAEHHVKLPEILLLTICIAFEIQLFSLFKTNFSQNNLRKREINIL